MAQAKGRMAFLGETNGSASFVPAGRKGPLPFVSMVRPAPKAYLP